LPAMDGFHHHTFTLFSTPPGSPEHAVMHDWYVRQAPTLLAAVAEACAEAYANDVEVNDLGFTKLWEWNEDDRDGEGARLVAHLLLMALSRAERLGYTAEDLAEFLRAARRAPQPAAEESHDV
jgi:hypothetical protein